MFHKLLAWKDLLFGHLIFVILYQSTRKLILCFQLIQALSTLGLPPCKLSREISFMWQKKKYISCSFFLLRDNYVDLCCFFLCLICLLLVTVFCNSLFCNRNKINLFAFNFIWRTDAGLGREFVFVPSFLIFAKVLEWVNRDSLHIFSVCS